MRILVIEDEKGIADVIANKLRQAEYVVDVCYDGLDGYYDARSGVYDLIILDMLDDRIVSAEEFSRYRFNGSLISKTKI